MENNQYSTDFNSTEEENINLREILEKYGYYWKWFILSVLICLATAFVYLRYAKKQYQVSAQILLKDKENASPELEAIKDAVSFVGKDNAMVNDQSKILKSRRLFTKVVEENHLNIEYFGKGRIRTEEVIEKESPVIFTFVENESNYSPKLKGKLAIEIEGNQFEVLEESFIKKGKYPFNQVIPSKFGAFTLVKNPSALHDNFESVEITVQSYLDTAEKLRNKIQIEAEKDNKSKVVNLSMVGNNVKKAEIIINSLIKIYNNDIQDDSKVIAKNTADFINNRLKIIANDLSGVDKSMEIYKTNNRINDLQAEAGMYMNTNMQVDKEVVELSAQLQIAQQMIQNLNRNTDALLPANVGFQDGQLNSGIDQYNQLVLEKQNLSKSMRDANPMMESLNENIKDVKSSVKNNLRIFQNTIQTRLATVQGKKGELTSKLNRMPEQESGFRKIARQQQIVEAIYLFLLQKREEAEIKSAAKVDAIKIVDWAYSNGMPVSPKTNIVYLGAFILGLAMPVGVLYLIFMMDSKIKNRQDVKQMYKGPILGDIPLAEEAQYTIKNNDHSSVAEAFRILRSNLQFMLPEAQGAQRILLTSTIPGEGKTFASINLAQVLAMSNKKVLVVGADLRSPKLLAYLGVNSSVPGLSNLLSDAHLSVEDCVIAPDSQHQFALLHSGVIPPNPSELLMSSRFDEIMKQLAAQYDYILLDAPPVSLVGDSITLSNHSDLTLFMVRVQHMDKRMLTLLDEMQQHKKLKNVAAVLNGIDPKAGYGYGYGYGHLHEKNKKKKFGFWNN